MPRDIDGIPKEARAAIRDCVKGGSRWPLLFWGSVGTGKTCAALVLLDKSGGWYWTIADFCEEMIQAQKGKLSRVVFGETRIITPGILLTLVEKAPLVVLDELGCRNSSSDFHYEQAKRILDRRAGKPLILISNSNPDQLSRQYDDRFASRACAGTIVEFSGKDRRLEEK